MNREEHLERLKTQLFDLLVIGGGGDGRGRRARRGESRSFGRAG